MSEQNVEKKLCSACRENKLIINFSNNKLSKDGKQHKCKQCVKEYMRNYGRLRTKRIKEIPSEEEMREEKIDKEKYELLIVSLKDKIKSLETEIETLQRVIIKTLVVRTNEDGKHPLPAYEN